MNESRRFSYYCQSLAPLVLIGYIFVNICCSNYQLQVVTTTTTTLIGTLSILSGLGVS
jgi:hypothetical protein